MSAPVRIQLRRTRGWRMLENTVKVDRTTKWGNPFVVGRDGTAAECVAQFRGEIEEHNCFAPIPKAGRPVFIGRPAIRAELGGKNLACWCKPGEPCHADVLLEMANAPHEVPFQ